MKKLLIFLLPLVLAFVACDNLDEPASINDEFIEGLNNNSVHYVRDTVVRYARTDTTDWTSNIYEMGPSNYLNSRPDRESYVSPHDIIIDGGKCWVDDQFVFKFGSIWAQYCIETGETRDKIFFQIPYSFNKENGFGVFGDLSGTILKFNEKELQICSETTELDRQYREIISYHAIEPIRIIDPSVRTFNSYKEATLFIIETLCSSNWNSFNPTNRDTIINRWVN